MSGSQAGLSFEIDSSQAQRAIAVLETLKATSISVTQSTAALGAANTNLTQTYGQERDALSRLSDQTKAYDGTLTGLIARLDQLRGKLNESQASFAIYNGLVKEATAQALQFNSTVDGLDRYISKTRELNIQIADVATGYARVSAALKNQTIEGYQAQVALEHLGVSMAGIAANRPDLVIQRMNDQLRGFRANAGTLAAVQEIMGKSFDARALLSAQAQPFITHTQALTTSVQTQQAAFTDESAAASQRESARAKRFQDELDEWRKRFTQDAMGGGLTRGSVSRFFLQSRADEHTELARIAALPKEQQRPYLRNQNQENADMMTSIKSTDWLQQYRTSIKNIQDQFAQDRDKGMAYVPALLKGWNSVVGTWVNQSTAPVPDTGKLSPWEIRAQRAQAGGILAGVGDTSLQNIVSLEERQRDFNTEAMRKRYRDSFGGGPNGTGFGSGPNGNREGNLEGDRRFENRIALQDRDVDYARDLANQNIDQTQRERYLMSLRPEERQRARTQLQYMETQGVPIRQIKPGTTLEQLYNDPRLSGTAKTAGREGAQQDLAGQAQTRSEDTVRQIEFQKQLVETLNTGRAAAENFTRAWLARNEAFLAGMDMDKQAKAALDALNLANQQRITQGKALVEQMRRENADKFELVAKSRELEAQGMGVYQRDAELAKTQRAQAVRKAIAEGTMPDPAFTQDVRENQAAEIAKGPVNPSTQAFGGAVDRFVKAIAAFTGGKPPPPEGTTAPGGQGGAPGGGGASPAGVLTGRAPGIIITLMNAAASSTGVRRVLGQLMGFDPKEGDTQHPAGTDKPATPGASAVKPPVGAVGQVTTAASVVEGYAGALATGPGAEAVAGVNATQAATARQVEDAKLLTSLMSEQHLSLEAATKQVEQRRQIEDALAKLEAARDTMSTEEFTKQKAILEATLPVLGAMDQSLRNLGQLAENLKQSAALAMDTMNTRSQMGLRPQDRAAGAAVGRVLQENLGSAGVSAVGTGEERGIGAAGTTRTGVPMSIVTSKSGVTAKVDSAAAPQFQALIDRLEAGGVVIRTMIGYQDRNIAGTNTPSQHMGADALDINAATNPWHSRGGDMPPDVATAAAAASHTSWGGLWRDRDAMHFEIPRGVRPEGAYQPAAGERVPPSNSAAGPRVGQLPGATPAAGPNYASPEDFAARNAGLPGPMVGGVELTLAEFDALKNAVLAGRSIELPRLTPEQNAAVNKRMRETLGNVRAGQEATNQTEQEAANVRATTSRQNQVLAGQGRTGDIARNVPVDPNLPDDLGRAKQQRDIEAQTNSQREQGATLMGETERHTADLRAQTDALTGAQDHGRAGLERLTAQQQAHNEALRAGPGIINENARAQDLMNEKLAAATKAMADNVQQQKDANAVQAGLNARGPLSSAIDQQDTAARIRLQQQFRDTPELEQSQAGQDMLKQLDANKALAEQTQRMGDLRDAAHGVEGAITSALEAVVVHGERGKTVLKSMVETIETTLFRAFVAKPFERAVDSIVTSLFGEDPKAAGAKTTNDGGGGGILDKVLSKVTGGGQAAANDNGSQGTVAQVSKALVAGSNACACTGGTGGTGGGAGGANPGAVAGTVISALSAAVKETGAMPGTSNTSAAPGAWGSWDGLTSTTAGGGYVADGTWDTSGGTGPAQNDNSNASGSGGASSTSTSGGLLNWIGKLFTGGSKGGTAGGSSGGSAASGQGGLSSIFNHAGGLIGWGVDQIGGQGFYEGGGLIGSWLKGTPDGTTGGAGAGGLLAGGSNTAVGAAMGGTDIGGGASTSFGTSSGMDMAFGAGGYASGGVFPGGSLAAYHHQIVDRPTPFRFAGGGQFGLMGEAGPEAVIPLSRGPGGKLGVANHGGGGGGGVTINVTTPDAESFHRSQSQIAARASAAMGRSTQRSSLG